MESRGEAAPSCHAEGSPGPCWCGVQAGMSLRQKPLLEAPRRAQPASWGRTPLPWDSNTPELIRRIAGGSRTFFCHYLYLPFFFFFFKLESNQKQPMTGNTLWSERLLPTCSGELVPFQLP